MANKIYWSKTALTGGAAGALDSIDGASLTDGDFAHVTVGGAIYIYKLDADSAAAESSPGVIAPDANAGDKRWVLQYDKHTELNMTGETSAEGDTASTNLDLGSVKVGDRILASASYLATGGTAGGRLNYGIGKTGTASIQIIHNGSTATANFLISSTGVAEAFITCVIKVVGDGTLTLVSSGTCDGSETVTMNDIYAFFLKKG